MIQERANGTIITVNELLKLAIYSLLSKKARTELTKRVKQLNITTGPHPGLFG